VDIIGNSVTVTRLGSIPASPVMISMFITQHDVNEQDKAYNYRKADPCMYCGRPSTTWDHMDPIGVHGDAAYGAVNLARACKNCNHDKGCAPLLMFLVYRRMGKPAEAGKFISSGMTETQRMRKDEFRSLRKKVVKPITRMYRRMYSIEI
jgi:hypothetical protein